MAAHLTAAMRMAAIRMVGKPMAQEVFELMLHGGAPERRYRHLQPAVDEIPWQSFEPRPTSEEVREAARRAWTEAALQEYSSAAAHSSLLQALVRCRAPVDLCAWASSFPAQELCHAEICARVASALGGATALLFDPEESFLFTAPCERPEMKAAALAVEICCVGESWSHAMLRAAWAIEGDPVLREVRRRLAKDEAGHAALGWALLDWMEPDLSPDDRRDLGRAASRALRTLDVALARVAELPDSYFSPLTVLGGLGREGLFAVARRSIDQTVLAPLQSRGICPA
jgi:hypothetical protein